MRSIRTRYSITTCAKTGLLGLALMSLASCSSGDSSTATPTAGGSAALQGPLVFVNNTGDRTLTTVALRGDSGNSVVNTLGAGAPGVFGNVALRYGLNSGITVSEELSRWFFLWMTFLGAVVGLVERAHLGTDMLVGRLGTTGKRVCLALALMAAASFVRQ